MHVKHPLVKSGVINLRSYQEAIVARAIDKNTLVVLPTGLGKTIIAAMVAAHRLYKFPDSKVLFLAPTRPLVVQHEKTLRGILTPMGMVAITGMDAISRRKELWNSNQMIFSTPQTIENDLYRGLDLKDVSLIIFDESHRAVGNYAYVAIAEEYMKVSKEPLIMGLTASPSADRETVEAIKKNLFIERVEARTDHDADVKPHIQGLKVEWLRVELPGEFKKVRRIIEDILRDDIRELKKMQYLKTANLSSINKRILLKLQSDIRKEISIGMDSYVPASLVASAMKISHALELLETQGISALESYLERLQKQRSRAIKRLFMDERMKNLVKVVHDLRVMGVEHPKVDELVRVVKEHKDKKIIVFTQYRDSVNKIIERLNENDILAHEFIGQASRGNKKGMTQKEQVRILENFKEGRYTALVATSVAEEGIDIPRVDIVIFYEPVPSEIRTIQRRGRTGRSRAGKVFVLMAKGTRDEAYYWSSLHKERRMGKLVREMRDDIDRDAGQQSLLKYQFKDKNNREGEIGIYVDVRERNARILKVLRDKARVELRQLPVGDFILSDRVCCERKTQADFVQSIIDRRLLTQARELSSNFEIPILIIEGEGDLYSLRDVHPNAIRGALAALAVNFGISVIPSRDEEDTANFLYTVAKREQDYEGREVVLRGEKKPLLLEERQRYIIESLPNVSAVLAKRLLEKFKSVKGVVNASEKELMKIEAIGKGKAEEISRIVRSRYTGKK